MIERHFFRDRLLKTFDFQFGYCIPHSKNTCEHVYEFPGLAEDLGELIDIFSLTYFIIFFLLSNHILMNIFIYIYHSSDRNDIKSIRNTIGFILFR